MYTTDPDDSVYYIDMYEAYFYDAGDTSIIYLLYTLAALFMFKLYKFHVQMKEEPLKEELNEALLLFCVRLFSKLYIDNSCA